MTFFPAIPLCAHLMFWLQASAIDLRARGACKSFAAAFTFRSRCRSTRQPEIGQIHRGYARRAMRTHEANIVEEKENCAATIADRDGGDFSRR
jgi:hypothetical protein